MVMPSLSHEGSDIATWLGDLAPGRDVRTQLRDSAGLAPASPFNRRPFGGGTRRGLQLVPAMLAGQAVADVIHGWV
jgi:hypothetical protein